ncbi:homoserine dehydrogenase [Alkalihalophilus lindianensis]|uniref:Homoserine dehydrogenase n=1 Tax=Alkalihalophilus lindianensis TaxID=1630542 RepID=A0ABU3XDG9_9BACI|nr:homoserine dehydrogenase [Alkalihalophilus lindianensis]MDV2685928.1 homoserine dehydrogenase [Alkalihalophilus lindianensis]
MLKVAILGFGTVGGSVYGRLEKSRKTIEEQIEEPFQITAILVKDRQKDRANLKDVFITTEWEQFKAHQKYDIVFEAIGGIEPAFTYTHYFLEQGIPVISANKKLVAQKGEELEKVATSGGAFYGYEAAVAGAVPIVNALRGTLATTAINQVRGILNGTTNYMLTEMIQKGRSFADVLLEAQQLGYAESDPTDDIESFDAWYKLIILSRLCFGKWADPEQISRFGVSEIENWHVEVASDIGCQVKLVGDSRLEEGEIKGIVSPAFVVNEELLASINGVTNGVVIYGEDIHELAFVGPGAGGAATANSMVEDYLFHKRYKGDRVVIAESNSKESASYDVVFVNQASYGECLHWAEAHSINIIESIPHAEGEAWIVKDAAVDYLHQPVYQLCGDLNKVKSRQHSKVL